MHVCVLPWDASNPYYPVLTDGGISLCPLYVYIMLYQLQIAADGSWVNTVYPPSDWETAQRRLAIYTSSFPNEKYALLEIPVV